MDEFSRTSVNFSGVPDLMNRFSERLAMASGISVTRFLGKSASGLNATGEGDHRNDVKSAYTRQMNILAPFYSWVDEIISRSARTAIPDYVFPPLFELSETDTAKIDLERARSAKLMVDLGSWDVQESKDYLASGKAPVGAVSEDAERLMSNTIDPEKQSGYEVTNEGATFDR
jgi:hypothetical protein